MIVGNRSFVSDLNTGIILCVFHSEGKLLLHMLVVKRWWISTVLQYDRCNVVNPPGLRLHRAFITSCSACEINEFQMMLKRG